MPLPGVRWHVRLIPAADGESESLTSLKGHDRPQWLTLGAGVSRGRGEQSGWQHGGNGGDRKGAYGESEGDSVYPPTSNSPRLMVECIAQLGCAIVGERAGVDGQLPQRTTVALCAPWPHSPG
eukprot:1735740-Prymnesium_polylepis.4